MAAVYKQLGGTALGATTLTDLYTVPASTSTIVASISVCNRGGTATTFRISIAPAGAADATSQYIVYDLAIAANDTYVLTAGICLATTDKVRGYAGNGNITMRLWGQELS